MKAAELAEAGSAEVTRQRSEAQSAFHPAVPVMRRAGRGREAMKPRRLADQQPAARGQPRGDGVQRRALTPRMVQRVEQQGRIGGVAWR